jgi:hypothetical protein
MSVETESQSSEPTEEDIIASFGEPEEGENHSVTSESSEATSTEDVASQGAEEADAGDEPPEFWSAERKALWSRIQDAEVRAAIKGHVDDASKAISGKMEEAAKARKEADEKAARLEAERGQSVSWWQANGPLLQQALAGKWAHFTPEYKLKLAQENPAALQEEQVRYEAEMGQWNTLVTRQRQEAANHQKMQEARHQQERAAEHQKLAAKFPKEFGTPEVAQKTYDLYSKYLLDHGIAADRLKGIYEAPVVEIVAKAYKFDQLQAKAKAVTTPKQAAQSVSTTPRRIEPGPARNAGNQGSDAERQALERLRTTGKAQEEDLRVLFR